MRFHIVLLGIGYVSLLTALIVHRFRRMIDAERPLAGHDGRSEAKIEEESDVSEIIGWVCDPHSSRQ